MKKAIILLPVYCLFFLNPLTSGEILNTFKIEADKKTYFVYYKPGWTEIRNKTFQKDHTDYTDVLITTIQNPKKDRTDYLVRFGFSKKDGARFYLMEKQKSGFKEVLSFSGSYITLPGDGTVRYYGNDTYSIPEIVAYRKTDQGFVKISQEKTYVGYETKATGPVKIYIDEALTTSIYSLERSEKVNILVRSGSSFFIQTDTGKCGWVSIPLKLTYRDTPLEGVYGISKTPVTTKGRP